jgi:hypothetical protein
MRERPLRRDGFIWEVLQDTERVIHVQQRGRPRKDLNKECVSLYPYIRVYADVNLQLQAHADTIYGDHEYTWDEYIQS